MEKTVTDMKPAISIQLGLQHIFSLEYEAHRSPSFTVHLFHTWKGYK